MPQHLGNSLRAFSQGLIGKGGAFRGDKIGSGSGGIEDEQGRQIVLCPWVKPPRDRAYIAMLFTKAVCIGSRGHNSKCADEAAAGNAKVMRSTARNQAPI
jgi:hypothetical protein